MAKYIDAERYINNLRELRTGDKDTVYEYYDDGIDVAISEAATFPAADIPRWIPVTERLPEEAFGCLVTVWDTDPISMDEFENLLPYFVGWDGEQWNDGDGEQCPFEVIAWMPLPTPYKGGDDE